jgi:hypothetical protein
MLPNTRSQRRTLVTLAVIVGSALIPSHSPTEAQSRGGGGRNYARSSVHGSGNNANVNRGANSNRNANVNRNTNVNNNVNVNRNVNVNNNVNVHSHGGYGYDRWGHPIARAAAVTATAVAIGTMVASLPPSCSALVVGPTTYQNCGGVYYQPVYKADTVQYVVVERP